MQLRPYTPNHGDSGALETLGSFSKHATASSTATSFETKIVHAKRRAWIISIPSWLIKTSSFCKQRHSLRAKWPRTHGNVFLRFCIVYCSQGNRKQPAHYLKQYKNAGKRFRVYRAWYVFMTTWTIAEKWELFIKIDFNTNTIGSV